MSLDSTRLYLYNQEDTRETVHLLRGLFLPGERRYRKALHVVCGGCLVYPLPLDRLGVDSMNLAPGQMAEQRESSGVCNQKISILARRIIRRRATI